ncbi:putative UDP-glucosyltransferase yojK [Fusarium austroafricanum]|uniref:Putative UDP-glucosyltransferase yojK n=1 Tax=Fusarium austroafricanum TaxID=2364996 RepID=A0A8H4K706_9HYPO|nr:putative UDP-glucosyltransferase yojK [Fusarium austroafricanum]
MKILLHSHFPAGHAYPMQAVAQSLVHRGHEVIWLTSDDNEARVLAVGATFVPTQAVAIIDAPLMAQNETGILDKMYNRLESRLLAQVRDYRRVLRDFEADVLLVDVMPYGARALYELGEIPVYATIGVIPMYMSSWGAPQAVSGKSPSTSLFWLIWNHLVHLISQWILLPLLLRPIINAQRKALGLPNLPYGEPIESFTYSPFLHIQASSPEMEFKLLPKPVEQKTHTKFVGPVVTHVPTNLAILPPDWDEIVAHPRVVGITQGTLAMDPTSLIIPAIEALSSDPDLLLVVASPHIEEITSRIGDVPNVRYIKWIPYHLFLPQLCLLITNGGYGSITQALSHKVPLICAGRTEDKKDTAARVSWAKAGIDLKTDNPSMEQVRCAARAILDDPGYVERAGRLGDELNELGGADRASELLEELVESKGR